MEKFTQIKSRYNEASQRLNEATQRRDEEQRELQTKVEQATQHTREILLQRVADIYQFKEEADLLELSENMVAKYRSRHGKTYGKYPISTLIE